MASPLKIFVRNRLSQGVEKALVIPCCCAMLASSAAVAVMRCLSVCLSVRPSRSWIKSKRINISSKFFTVVHSTTILVFRYQTSWHYSDGVECKGYEKWRFSTNISLNLRNHARYSHSYYGKRIGNCTQAFE